MLRKVTYRDTLSSLLAIAEGLRAAPPHHTLKLCLGNRIFDVNEKDTVLQDLGFCEGASVTAILHRTPLARSLGWNICCPRGQTGAGNVNTIVDLGRKACNGNQPCWWTSLDGKFKGRVWRQLPPNTAQEPYSARDQAPELVVTFPRPTTLRAVAIAARNLPREVVFLPDEASFGPLLHFRPDGDHPPGIQQPPVWSEDYMLIVHEMLPGGVVSSNEVYERYPMLPTLFPDPLHCKQLKLRLLSCHEGRWVGINNLAFFE